MSLEFRCADVGVVCRGKITADTAEDLIQKVAAHAADAHDVPELSQTLVDYAVSTVRVQED
ncbi:MAG: DUF1059 domain-containing protein [Acidimicrobiia bacterium]